MTQPVRILSGMRPTGDLHLGNYFGAIVQFLELQADDNTENFYFVADIHALTKIHARIEVGRLSLEVTKNYLACGVDPNRCTLYRQSDVPEIPQISLLLSNIVHIGALHRCTSFKDELRKTSLEENEASLGLLSYPVLMAADILCVRSNRVPVGKDQIQHVEMARDWARKFNNLFGHDTFVVPEINLRSPITVPGINGSQKMGKSDNNTIALLDPPTTVLNKIKRIPTQSEPGPQMTQGTEGLFILSQLCSPADAYEEFLRRHNAGETKFFGEMKKRLAADITILLTPIQDRYQQLTIDDVRDVLSQGAKHVRPIAASVLESMQKAMGLVI